MILTDQEIDEFAETLIREHAYNRSAAVMIARKSARWAESAALERLVPVAWLIFDEKGYLQHAASWEQAAHEHINDAIASFDIQEAAKWIVRPVCIIPQAEPPTS